MEILEIVSLVVLWLGLIAIIVMAVHQLASKKNPSVITPEIAQRNLDIALKDAIDELERADTALAIGDHAARYQYIQSAKNCINFAADMQEIIDNSTGSNHA